jgi:four helix bundle protein
MSKYETYEVALEFVRALRPLIEKIGRHSKSLKEQLVGAGTSVPLNVAEGRKRAGGDRLHCFRIAAGSAGESIAILETCEALGFVTLDEIRAAVALANRELAMLWKQTH